MEIFNFGNIQFWQYSILTTFNFVNFQICQLSILATFKFGNLNYQNYHRNSSYTLYNSFQAKYSKFSHSGRNPPFSACMDLAIKNMLLSLKYGPLYLTFKSTKPKKLASKIQLLTWLFRYWIVLCVCLTFRIMETICGTFFSWKL